MDEKFASNAILASEAPQSFRRLNLGVEWREKYVAELKSIAKMDGGQLSAYREKLEKFLAASDEGGKWAEAPLEVRDAVSKLSKHNGEQDAELFKISYHEMIKNLLYYVDLKSGPKSSAGIGETAERLRKNDEFMAFLDDFRQKEAERLAAIGEKDTQGLINFIGKQKDALKNPSDIPANFSKPLSRKIEAFRDKFGADAARALVDEFITTRKNMLAQAEQRLLELEQAKSSNAVISTREGGERRERIESMIWNEMNRWQRNEVLKFAEYQKIIENDKDHALLRLKDSRSFFIDKAGKLENDFNNCAIPESFKKVLEALRADGQEQRAAQLKAQYAESFRHIVLWLDAKIKRLEKEFARALPAPEHDQEGLDKEKEKWSKGYDGLMAEIAGKDEVWLDRQIANVSKRLEDIENGRQDAFRPKERASLDRIGDESSRKELISHLKDLMLGLLAGLKAELEKRAGDNVKRENDSQELLSLKEKISASFAGRKTDLESLPAEKLAKLKTELEAGKSQLANDADGFIRQHLGDALPDALSADAVAELSNLLETELEELIRLVDEKANSIGENQERKVNGLRARNESDFREIRESIPNLTEKQIRVLLEGLLAQAKELGERGIEALDQSEKDAIKDSGPAKIKEYIDWLISSIDGLATELRTEWYSRAGAEQMSDKDRIKSEWQKHYQDISRNLPSLSQEELAMLIGELSSFLVSYNVKSAEALSDEEKKSIAALTQDEQKEVANAIVLAAESCLRNAWMEMEMKKAEEGSVANKELVENLSQEQIGAIDALRKKVDEWKGLVAGFDDAVVDCGDDPARLWALIQEFREQSKEILADVNGGMPGIRLDKLVREEIGNEIGRAIAKSIEEAENRWKDLKERLRLPIEADVLQQFRDRLNIDEAGLKGIEGFDKLSKAQQLLILENLQQLALGRVEEAAASRLADKKKDDVVWGSRILARVRDAITAKYDIGKEQKEVATEYKHGGIEVHKQALEQLVKGFANNGPDASIDAEGNININFSQQLDFGPRNAEQEKILAEFDSAANEFGRTPDEWLYDTANVENRAKYLLRRRRFQAVRNALVGELDKEYGKKVAFARMAEVDMKVQMNQFLFAHPEAAKELENIAQESVLQKAVLKTVAEKGLYSSLGFAAKSSVVAAFSVAAAPLAAAGLGAGFAWRRAVKDLERNDKLARRGEKNIGSESRDYAEASYYSETLEFLIDEIHKGIIEQDGKLTDKGAEQLRSLRWHYEEAEKKKAAGEIDYGSHEAGRVGEQYRLMKNMTQAAGILVYFELLDSPTQKKKDKGETSFRYRSEKADGFYGFLNQENIQASEYFEKTFGLPKQEKVLASDYYKQAFEHYNADMEVIAKYLKTQWKQKIKTRASQQLKTAAIGAGIAAGFAALGAAAREVLIDDSMGIKQYLAEKSSEIKRIVTGERVTPKVDFPSSWRVGTPTADVQMRVIDGDAAPIVSARDAINNPAYSAVAATMAGNDPDFDAGNLTREVSSASIAERRELLSAINGASNNEDIPGPTESTQDTSKQVNAINASGSEIAETPQLNVSENAPSAEQLKLATIGRGAGSNSIEGVFIKQLAADPSRFGYTGDLDDKAAIKSWAGTQAHRIAMANGYFDQKTGIGIRMRGESVNHNAYVLRLGEDGRVGVDEYQDGELRETRQAGQAVEQNLDRNEYRQQEGVAIARAEVGGGTEMPVAKTETLSQPVEVEPAFVNEAAVTSTVDSSKIDQTLTGAIDENIVDGSSGKMRGLNTAGREMDPETFSNFVNSLGASPTAETVTESNVQPVASESGPVTSEVKNFLANEQAAVSAPATRIESRPDISFQAQMEADNKIFYSNIDILEPIRHHGVGIDRLKAIGIDPNIVWDWPTQEKVNFLNAHTNNLEGAYRTIQIANALETDKFSEVQEYSVQLSSVKDGSEAQKAIADIFVNKGDLTKAYPRLFGIELKDGQTVLDSKDSKNAVIRNVAPGYELHVTNQGGEIHFGLKGPMGKHWGADGDSRIFKVDAELNQDSLDKLAEKLANLNKSSLPQPKDWR